MLTGSRSFLHGWDGEVMPEKEVFLTPEGLEKLKAELDHLFTVRRPQIAEQIQKAKELGGTVDNAEYDDAKNEQAFVEGRILTLEKMIKNAVIIEEDESKTGLVKLGSKVTVRSEDGIEEFYTVVGSAEADPSQNKISNESPVGNAIIGKKAGNTVKVKTPAGEIKLKIVEVG